MLYFDRIDISERIDVHKTSASKQCNICLYWYFLNYSFKFQPNVWNGCHDLLMRPIYLIKIILNIKCSDYRCIISLLSKYETISLVQNAGLTEKRWALYKRENYKLKRKKFEGISKNGKRYKIWRYWNPKTKILPS